MIQYKAIQPWCRGKHESLTTKILKHSGNFRITSDHGTAPINYLTSPETKPRTPQIHMLYISTIQLKILSINSNVMQCFCPFSVNSIFIWHYQTYSNLFLCPDHQQIAEEPLTLTTYYTKRVFTVQLLTLAAVATGKERMFWTKQTVACRHHPGHLSRLPVRS